MFRQLESGRGRRSSPHKDIEGEETGADVITATKRRRKSGGPGRSAPPTPSQFSRRPHESTKSCILVAEPSAEITCSSRLLGKSSAQTRRFFILRSELKSWLSDASPLYRP